jgi:uncharacterized protein involved in type VI secretion and phage assembly
MANQGFASALLVEVEGSPLPADLAILLTYAYLDDSRNLPDLFVLRFRDQDRIVLEKGKFTIGAKVKLSIQTSDGTAPEVLLSGEVTAVEAELDRTGSVTEIRGLDHAHRLFRGRRVTAFADMTVADIVRKVAQRAGLQLGQIDDAPGIAGTSNTELTQENVSDWEFLSRLADLAGAEIAVIDGKLDFLVPQPPSVAPAPTTSAHQSPLVLEAGRNLVSLRACVTSAEQVPQVEVRGWDFLHKQAVSATAPAEAPATELPDVTPAKLAKAFASPNFVATDVPYRSQRAAQTAATALAAHLAGAFAEVEGVAKGNPKLRAGAAVALANVGKPFEGRYTLSSTRHLFSQEAGYTTSFVAAGRQERSLYGLASQGGGGGRRDLVAGLVPAVVSDVKDPEKLGRVRLTFPWLAADYTSGWARTVQLGGGPQRGTLILPEVGDEVLVGFEQGDFDAPYVLGGLHNGTDKPPTTPVDVVDGSSGAVNGRYFVSRTGHRLDFTESASAANEVKLATGDGKHVFTLDQKATKVTLHSDGSITIEAKNGVTVDAGSGPLDLKGQKVSITSQSDVIVNANAKLTLTGNSEATLKGAQAKVEGTAAAELTASGSVTVRGGIVRIN